MKKLLAIILTAFFLFSLASCGNDPTPEPEDTSYAHTDIKYYPNGKTVLCETEYNDGGVCVRETFYSPSGEKSTETIYDANGNKSSYTEYDENGEVISTNPVDPAIGE